MANMILINYYVRLIKKGMYNIEDVPMDVRQIVQDILDGNEIEPPCTEPTNDEIIIPLPKDDKIGARTLDNKSIYIDLNEISDRKILAAIKIDDIFHEDIFDIDVNNPTFELLSVEDMFGRLSSLESVEIFNKDNKLEIELNCKLKDDVISYKEFLRIDIRVVSNNYEDMRFTVYFITK